MVNQSTKVINFIKLIYDQIIEMKKNSSKFSDQLKLGMVFKFVLLRIQTDD